MLKFRSGRAGLCLALFTLLAAPLSGGPARADDLRPVLDRIDRLERDLNQVQRQVYRGQVGTAQVAPTGGDSGAAVDVQIRMDQLEAQMRTLTGQLEEIQYNIAQVTGRLDKMKADDEVRFQQLEGHGGPPPGDAVTAAAPPAAPPPPPAVHGAADMSRAASAAGTLTPPSDAAPAQNTPAATVSLPNGSALDQYNYAFGLLRESDYKAAEGAFKAFLQKHPTDPLASNAQYWLGETFFVRGDFPQAASAFAEGYQRAPQGPKAPDNLLKMGMSLGNSGKKQEACFSFARLERDFPQMAPIIKDREVSEKKRIGC
jgi:tol-pal system protein YbgF